MKKKWNLLFINRTIMEKIWKRILKSFKNKKCRQSL